VLGGVASIAVLCPISAAALARTDEMAADRYAADHGLALPLATELHVRHADQRAARVSHMTLGAVTVNWRPGQVVVDRRAGLAFEAWLLLNTDQIRCWLHNRTTRISPGTVLILPAKPHRQGVNRIGGQSPRAPEPGLVR
jgi:hypothetical protein